MYACTCTHIHDILHDVYTHMHKHKHTYKHTYKHTQNTRTGGKKWRDSARGQSVIAPPQQGHGQRNRQRVGMRHSP